MKHVSGLIGLIFLGFLASEIVAAVRSHIATRWKHTLGKVKHWDIGHEADSEDTTVSIRGVTYTYSTSGKDFESTNIGFGFPSRMSVLWLEGSLKKIFRRAPEVTVYYDPLFPQRSVLLPGVQLHHLAKISALGVMAILLFLPYAKA